jgi:hypothetical protein
MSFDFPFVRLLGVRKLCYYPYIHGIVYIPPENYRYAWIDALSEIENQFQNFGKKYQYFCLHSDFNSRTSK